MADVSADGTRNIATSPMQQRYLLFSMTRYILILTFFLLTIDVYSQTSSFDKAIFNDILMNEKTCGRLLFTDRTDTFFINQFSQELKRKDTWLHRQGKSAKIILQNTDKARILRELNTNKTNEWKDEIMLNNGKIVQLDSIYHVENYIDMSCLLELENSNKNIKLISIGKPIYLTDGNSFVIYVVEIGIHPKWKKFNYASSKLILYRRTVNKWTQAGYLYNGYSCNG